MYANKTEENNTDDGWGSDDEIIAKAQARLKLLVLGHTLTIRYLMF